MKCCVLLIKIIEKIVERDQKKRRKEWEKMFDVGIILIVVVLVLIMVAIIICIKKPSAHLGISNQQKRSFTEEDRQAVLLIRELGDIIDVVEKKL